MTRLTILTVLSLALANANGRTVEKAAEETNNTSAPFMPIITLEEPVFFKLTEYTDKICKNQPTCHLVKNAPESHQQMGVRNCMCDEDCRKYGDCCLDSPFYNETEQKANFQAFYCSSKDLVYQIATCPAYYNITEVRTKCENSIQPLATDNVKLIIPVTSTKNRITYANEYCAQCHGDWDYQPWTQTYYCSEDVFLNTDSEVGTNTTTERDYLWETTQAAKHVKFDPVTKTFRSIFNNRNYTCPPSISLPETLRPLARLCVPAVSKCSNTSDRQAVERCRAYTSIVYDDSIKYKNRDCAICNGKTKKLPGCKERVPQAGPASSLFSSGNKGSGNTNACKDPNVKDKFC